MGNTPEMNIPTQADLLEEDRKIRVFRVLTDLTLRSLYLDPIRLHEAQAMVQNLRKKAEGFFPGKGYVFDLVVRPRLERVISERFCSMN